jgi:uncharacterized protein YceK
MPARARRLLGVLTLAGLAGGCGSLSNTLSWSADAGGRRPYGGVRTEAEGLAQMQQFPSVETPRWWATTATFLAIDLPLSAVADTILLPVNLWQQWEDRPGGGKTGLLRDLPGADRYKADPYIAAAVMLQAEGPVTATILLKRLAVSGGGEQTTILCRMLFTEKPNGKFRRPLLGGPGFVGDTDDREWMREPLEIVDGVPFHVVTGYLLGGFPEPGSNYLKYCLAECDWTGEKYKPKTAVEKQAALAKLVASPRWKTPLTPEQVKVLAAQIE